MQLPNDRLVVFDPVTQKVKDARTEQMVDSLFTSMKKNGLWETIALLVKRWEETHTDEAKEFYSALNETRKTRSNEDYADTKDKSTRYLAEIPIRINTAINILIPDIVFHNAGYHSRDSRKFLIEFARKFPQFRVGKKL